MSNIDAKTYADLVSMAEDLGDRIWDFAEQATSPEEAKEREVLNQAAQSVTNALVRLQEAKAINARAYELDQLADRIERGVSDPYDANIIRAWK